MVFSIAFSRLARRVAFRDCLNDNTCDLILVLLPRIRVSVSVLRDELTKADVPSVRERNKVLVPRLTSFHKRLLPTSMRTCDHSPTVHDHIESRDPSPIYSLLDPLGYSSFCEGTVGRSSLEAFGAR